MPNARQVLDLLSRDELVTLVDTHKLDVADRRQRAPLIDKLANLPLADLLADFPRERLKELCRDLSLDDAGRDKASIIARITTAKSAQASLFDAPAKPPAPLPDAPKTSTAARPKNQPTKATSTAASLDVSPDAVLTIDALERYLWSAADILRGSIDSSDYKNFIFGLLFLKRLSDRFDEECDLLQAAGDDPEDRDNHPFFVPKRARWPEIQRVATNIGAELNKACAALEASNTALDGVLAGIDYNDERKLGDARISCTPLQWQWLGHFEFDKLSAIATGAFHNAFYGFGDDEYHQPVLYAKKVRIGWDCILGQD